MPRAPNVATPMVERAHKCRASAPYGVSTSMFAASRSEVGTSVTRKKRPTRKAPVPSRRFPISSRSRWRDQKLARRHHWRSRRSAEPHARLLPPEEPSRRRVNSSCFGAGCGLTATPYRNYVRLVVASVSLRWFVRMTEPNGLFKSKRGSARADCYFTTNDDDVEPTLPDESATRTASVCVPRVSPSGMSARRSSV